MWKHSQTLASSHMPEMQACSAARLAAYLDPYVPWSAMAAQMNVAPWEAPPHGKVPPVQAAALMRCEPSTSSFQQQPTHRQLDPGLDSGGRVQEQITAGGTSQEAVSIAEHMQSEMEIGGHMYGRTMTGAQVPSQDEAENQLREREAMGWSAEQMQHPFGGAKVFVVAGTAHGLVHIWQAVGWGASMWQRIAVKGQVIH